MKKISEWPSYYDDLEKKSSEELLRSINNEDKKVAYVVESCIPVISPLVDAIVKNIEQGGRLFYLGAGTSGRLGVVDASECPPTFGVPNELVVGLIAGGDQAIRKAVEHAEDNKEQAWKDLEEHAVNKYDCIIGIAASGTTPYVLGAIEKAQSLGMVNAGITVNPTSPLSSVCQYPIVVPVGPGICYGKLPNEGRNRTKISAEHDIHLGHDQIG